MLVGTAAGPELAKDDIHHRLSNSGELCVNETSNGTAMIIFDTGGRDNTDVGH